MSTNHIGTIDNIELSANWMPEQKPGRSKQTYGTPWEFVHAVEKRFGPIVCDLAANADNKKCDVYYDEAADSLSQPWALNHPTGNLWINPPYKNIALWAKKCHEESLKRTGSIIMLIPASIGSNYFASYIHQKALVLALSPRLVFEGETSSFPKDLMVCLYTNGVQGFDVWRWKK